MRLTPAIVGTRCHSRGGRVLMRTRSLGAGRICSRMDTLSRERADMCVAALSVERTVAYAVGHW